MIRQPNSALPLVVILGFDPAIASLVAEVLPLEGYEVQCVHTEAKAWSLLARQPGKCIVLVDNLHVHQEGQELLLKLRKHPDVRAYVRVVCMMLGGSMDPLRQKYGELIDAYLLMPFTFPQLLTIPRILLNRAKPSQRRRARQNSRSSH